MLNRLLTGLLIALCIGCASQKNAHVDVNFDPPLQLVMRVDKSQVHAGDTLLVDVCVRNKSMERVGFCQNASMQLVVRQGRRRNIKYLTEVEDAIGIMPSSVNPEIVWLTSGQIWKKNYAVVIDNSMFTEGINKVYIDYSYPKVLKKWCRFGMFDSVCYMHKATRPVDVVKSSE